METKLDLLIEDIASIVKELDRKNRELEARNTELVLALEQCNERMMHSELAASTHRAAIDDALRKALQTLDETEAAVASLHKSAESDCATCTAQAARLILQLQNNAVSIVEQAQRDATCRNQDSQRKVTDVLAAARQSLRSLADHPAGGAPQRRQATYAPVLAESRQSGQPATADAPSVRTDDQRPSTNGNRPLDEMASLLTRVLQTTHNGAGHGQTAAPGDFTDCFAHPLDQFSELGSVVSPNGNGTRNGNHHEATFSPPGQPPADFLLDFPGFPPPAPKPTPPASIRLVASPIRSFASLSAFHRALKQLAGVIEVKPIRFDRDCLSLSITYADPVSLANRLPELAGFQLEVISTTGDTVEVALAYQAVGT